MTRRGRWAGVAAVLLGLSAAGAGAVEPSAAHREGLRRTAELRKERRRGRGRGAAAVGSIVPYPMPPALVIRQTPAVHDEVEGLLDLLRR